MDEWILKNKKLISEFRPEIGFFEREQLLPEMVARLKFIREFMKQIVETCESDSTAILIDASLREVLNENGFNFREPEPRVGVEYLGKVKNMVNESFIDVIDDLTSNARVTVALSDIDHLVAYFNELNLFFNSIFFVKEKVFRTHYRTFVNMRNPHTGKVLVKPPFHAEIILVPFEGFLEEMVNVARRSAESIDLWANQIRESRRKHIELYVSLYQIKTNKSQATASMFAFLAQVAAVLLVFILIYYSPTANLYIEKYQMEKSLESLLASNKRLTTNKEELENTIKVEKQLNLELKLDLDKALQRKVKKPL